MLIPSICYCVFASQSPARRAWNTRLRELWPAESGFMFPIRWNWMAGYRGSNICDFDAARRETCWCIIEREVSATHCGISIANRRPGIC